MNTNERLLLAEKYYSGSLTLSDFLNELCNLQLNYKQFHAWSTKHKEEIPSKINPPEHYKCLLCNSNFNNLQSLSKHYKSFHIEEKHCRICSNNKVDEEVRKKSGGLLLCKNCYKIQNKIKSGKVSKEKRVVYNHKTRLNLKSKVFLHYGKKCNCCGETNSKFLTLDHKNNDGYLDKNKDIYRSAVNNNYPDTLQLLCFNCNCGKSVNRGVCPHISSKIIVPISNNIKKITSEKESICDICGFKSKSIKGLKHHISLKHSNKNECRTCLETLTDVNRTTRRRNGNICIKCNKEQNKQLQKNIPKEKINFLSQLRNAKIKKEVIGKYGGKCACCNEKNIHFLTIDHVKNNGAEHRKEIKKESMFKWIKRNNFPSDYQVLCFNCNCGRYINGNICPHQEKDK